MYKTRSAATDACKGGHVKINDQPVKPSYQVSVGETVQMRSAGRQRILEVTGLVSKRVGYPVAVRNYIDHSPPPPPRIAAMPVPQRERGAGRPTKKERRQLDRLRGRDSRFS